MEDKDKTEVLNYVAGLLLKRIKKIEKNMDEDISSMEITGQYVHYHDRDTFDKARAELLELKEGYKVIKEIVENKDD